MSGRVDENMLKGLFNGVGHVEIRVEDPFLVGSQLAALFDGEAAPPTTKGSVTITNLQGFGGMDIELKVANGAHPAGGTCIALNVANNDAVVEALKRHGIEPDVTEKDKGYVFFDVGVGNDVAHFHTQVS